MLAIPGFLMVPGGGTVEPMTPALLDVHRDKIHMNGPGVFKFAVNKMSESAQMASMAACTDAGSMKVPTRPRPRTTRRVSRLDGAMMRDS